MQVLKKLGFLEAWKNIIWWIISNKWYSVNINDTRHGFFKSSRGINQEDPLSPSFFVIGVELLTKLLDSLVNHNFIPFQVDKNSPNITHLCYADDTILFSLGDPLSLAMMMNKLDIYERYLSRRLTKASMDLLFTQKLQNYSKIKLRISQNFLISRSLSPTWEVLLWEEKRYANSMI